MKTNYIILKLLNYKPNTKELKAIFQIMENLDPKNDTKIIKIIDGGLKRIKGDAHIDFLERDVVALILSKLCKATPVFMGGKKLLNIERNFNVSDCINYYKITIEKRNIPYISYCTSLDVNNLKILV